MKNQLKPSICAWNVQSLNWKGAADQLVDVLAILNVESPPSKKSPSTRIHSGGSMIRVHDPTEEKDNVT